MKISSLTLTLALALSGCAADISLPPAPPLTASAEALAKVPNLEAGSFKVKKGEPVEWKIGDQTLRVRVVEPEGAGPFPLVVFSHGFASDVDQYDALFVHWASHGYIVIAPFHLDGGGTVHGIFSSVRYGSERLVQARVENLHAVLDHLGELDAVEPGLAARVDRTRIAAAGHSFGAFTAQQMGGAASVDPKDGKRIEGLDTRVRASLAISPPGEMFKIINGKSWLTMATPMLVTTGTWDLDGRFVHDWHQHELSYDTAPAGRNWVLVTQGADHYLGNLICRTDRDKPSQVDALRMVNAMAVTFLDAFVKDDAAARAFLDSHPLAELTGGFSALEKR